MSESGRITPLPIKRQLRQEANFGCGICGNPILDYHHIIPYHISRAYLPQDMIALCPNHHRRANQREYSDKYLRELKTSPHNRERVRDAFFIESDELIVYLGNCKCIDTPRALVVDDFDIVSVEKIENSPTVNLNLFDKFTNWIAAIYENSWIVDTTLVWDLEYHPRHLVFRSAPRNISLDFKIEGSNLLINGILHYNGHQITMNNKGIATEGFLLDGATVVHGTVGFNVTTPGHRRFRVK